MHAFRVQGLAFVVEFKVLCLMAAVRALCLGLLV